MRTALAPLLIVVAALLVCGGCQKSIFNPDEPRSQYDRYDAVRNQREPQYLEDEFGRRRPNLRGRLMPKD